MKYNADPISIGKKIMQLRKAKKMTQEEFGKKVGLDKTAISKIENGKQYLTVQQLVDISNSLKININYFLDVTFAVSQDTENILQCIQLFTDITTTKEYSKKVKDVYQKSDFVFNLDSDYLVVTGRHSLFEFIRGIAKANNAKPNLLDREYYRRIEQLKKKREKDQDGDGTQNERYFLVSDEQMDTIIDFFHMQLSKNESALHDAMII